MGYKFNLGAFFHAWMHLFARLCLFFAIRENFRENFVLQNLIGGGAKSVESLNSHGSLDVPCFPNMTNRATSGFGDQLPQSASRPVPT